MSELTLEVGDKVVKVGGDYSFSGVVVAAFTKQSGARRVVVENAQGILHIFAEAQLKRRSVARQKVELVW